MFLLFVHLDDVLLLSLVLLQLFCIHSHLGIVIVLSSLDIIFHLLLHGMITFDESLFFLLLQTPSFLPFAIQLLVSVPLCYDLFGFLLRFLDLLPCLLFFHLEQLDTVCQQLRVFFSTLSRCLRLKQSLSLKLFIVIVALVIAFIIMLVRAVLLLRRYLLMIFLHR